MSKHFSDDEEDLYAQLEEGEEKEYCEVCNLSYKDVCPINSPDCPFRDAFAEDEEDSDFEDIKDIDKIVGYDEEAERAVDEAGEDPGLEEDDDLPERTD